MKTWKNLGKNKQFEIGATQESAVAVFVAISNAKREKYLIKFEWFECARKK